MRTILKIRNGLIVLLLLVLSAGCGWGYQREPRQADLTSPDTSLRIRAVRWVAQEGLMEAGPQLVSMLEDEDLSVRFYACQALTRLYGTDYGYDYKQPANQRLAAVKRWRAALQLDGEKPEQSD